MNKKHLLLLLLLSLSFGVVMAQDVIVKKDGSTILSKVLEISETEIKYKKWSNQDGPMYSVNKNEVNSINYQNGEVEKYSDEISMPKSDRPVASELPVYGKGYLGYVPYYKLTLDGDYLSEDEARLLLGKEGFEDFLSGCRMMRTSAVFELIYYITGIPGILGLTYGYVGGNYTAIAFGWAGISVAVPCLVLYGVFLHTGRNRINDLVAEYNRHNDKAVSFHFSPTIIQPNSFASQGNLGLGLTLSMDF